MSKQLAKYQTLNLFEGSSECEVDSSASQNSEQLRSDSTIAGRVINVDQDPEKPYQIFEHPNGELWHGDSLEWLKLQETESVDLIFADPPYNIKKAEWDSFASQEAYVEWSLKWISEASRILKPSGTMYVCGFSEILADIKLPSLQYFKGCRWLIWYYRNKANLGKDWGRSHESILHFRKSKSFTMNVDDVRIPYNAHTLKYPEHPQAKTSQYGKGKKRKDNWFPNPNGAKPKDVIEVPTTCNGMGEKTPHPTQKPEELVRKFILASSRPGDCILDPFLGSGTTAVVCEQLERKWKGCDLEEEYLGWAIDRINSVSVRDFEYWVQRDRENAKRRSANR